MKKRIYGHEELAVIEEMKPGTWLKFFKRGFYTKYPEHPNITEHTLWRYGHCLACEKANRITVYYGSQSERDAHASGCAYVREIVELGMRTSHTAMMSIRKPAQLHKRLNKLRDDRSEVLRRIRLLERESEQLESRIYSIKNELGED